MITGWSTWVVRDVSRICIPLLTGGTPSKQFKPHMQEVLKD
jgi:hypothetical protein